MEIMGMSGASGKAVGKAVFVGTDVQTTKSYPIEDAEGEIRRLNCARNSYKEELRKLCESAKKELGKEAAGIFQAYEEIVKDDVFFGALAQKVREEKRNIEYLLDREKKTVAEQFRGMEDSYMRDRGADIENVCDELIRKMKGETGQDKKIEDPGEDYILISEELAPADTIRLGKKYLRGIVTEKGGPTSHTVILAKSLGIPAIVGAVGIMHMRGDIEGECLYMDGATGEIVVRPGEEILREYARVHERMERQKRELETVASEPAVTTDGRAVKICVNAGELQGVENLRMGTCDGIGLFRTEFLYMSQEAYPSEEMQAALYRKLAEKAAGKEVIIRTLDIGGDKRVDYMDLPGEDNPFLGYRAIRICLDRPQMFKEQLRAILRASAYGNLAIMLPMITNAEEVRMSRDILDECKEELRKENRKYDENIRIGIMIETPSAVLISDLLAREVDFFSIGSNDLIQYTMAADRMNRKVRYLYRVSNPSVLRAIEITVRNAHAAGIPVGICGEAASDECLTPVWVGLGVDELSMVPGQTAKIKRIIRRLSVREASEITKRVFAMEQADEIEAYLEAVFNG